MTANFDAARSAALTRALANPGLPVLAADRGMTRSHQFAIEAGAFGGGQTASKTLRKAGFLACGIGLPIAEVAGDLNGLRIGTPELVWRGVTPADVPALATLIAEALRSNAPRNHRAPHRRVARPLCRSAPHPRLTRAQ